MQTLSSLHLKSNRNQALTQQKMSLRLPKRLPTAEVCYTRPVGTSSTLIGLVWAGPVDTAMAEDVNEFNLESLGTVEATGTESRRKLIGGAIYDEFHGKVGDVIELKPAPSSF